MSDFQMSRCMDSLQEEIKIENASFIKSHVLEGKEKNICSYKQMETPKSPNSAMEFLCRSWKPSASEYLQIFSPKAVLTKEQGDENLKTPDRTYTAAIKQENIKMDFRHPKMWLRGKSLTSLLRSQDEKKEEKRLQTAQIHAALSLTQLAAAIAGISSSIGKQECSPYDNGKQGASSQDMSTVLPSAAALITNVCAEAAESLGAQRSQVRAAVDSGMAIQTPFDMMAVTATAATCLRGAALLKSRSKAVPLSRIHEMLKVHAEICTVMPSGRKECSRISVYLKHDHLMFCFRKKYFGGALTSAKEYQVTNISEERTEDQGSSFLCLKTKSGVIKLLFEDEMESKMWTSTILNLLEMINPCWQQASHTKQPF